MLSRAIAALVASVLAGAALAHDGVVHKTEEEAKAHAAEVAARVKANAPTAPSAGLAFPVEIKAQFALTDHTGRDVTQADFADKPMAIFFGYANCEAICSVALPRLGQALDILGEDAKALVPLVITVDPDRDTVDAMGPALAKWHPKLIGLTGTQDALAEARKAFQVEISKVMDDIDGKPIYAHGSFIYLIGGDGKVLTLLPPILGPERMAEIIKGYL